MENIILIGGGVIAVLLFLLVIGIMIASRIRIPAPNEALIIAGSGSNGADDSDQRRKQAEPVDPSDPNGPVKTEDGLIIQPPQRAASDLKVVTGSRVFVMPFTQKVHRISLEQRKFNVTANAFTNNHIRLDIRAVAAIKVDDTAEAIRLAAQRFLGEEERIAETSEQVLEGALRAIIGTMTAEEINQDREGFATRAEEIAVKSLEPQGLRIDSFHIQDVQDETGYLRNLSRPEEAEAAQKADVAEETARREAEIARIQADQRVKESQRDLDLRAAEIAEETAAAKARAEAAGPLAEAQAHAEVVEQQSQTARRRAELREQELDAEVRRPAEAARFQTEQEAAAKKAAEIARAEAEAERTTRMANAQKLADIANAEAQASRTRTLAEADKASEIARAEAQAEGTERLSAAELKRREDSAKAIRAEGEAEAAAILAKGEAEAEALEKKAKAYEKMGPIALADHFITTLPEVITAAGKPMESIDSLTVIDANGASKVVQSGLNNLTQITDLGKQLFGVDLTEILSGSGSSNDVNPDATPTAAKAAAAVKAASADEAASRD